ncbi:hypothetical protein N7450_000540 [Penicillium hetheringtonii]|uniref:DUF4604 domain-containing protein n=1 Tax=Penicillium hetheringtonii TaxID=911720 RepID=A0AAD6E3P7_9EURO|nr:hypothetical protein N7450_000540 [Penicillium hetheringtonii]
MSKNSKLAYVTLIDISEANEPAFLQKLRGQYGDNSGRLERPAARPLKAKDKRDEEEDEPVYVDEESNEVISKEEYKALVGAMIQNRATKDSSTADNQDESTSQPEPTSAKQSNLTEVGGQKKRKQAKVVGEDTKPEPDEPLPAKASTTRKPKKAKKIKLSFDEE